MAAMEAAEKLASTKSTKTEGPTSAIDFGGIAKMIVSFLARNFFTLKLIALVIAFTINFMLLFYKVSTVLEFIGIHRIFRYRSISYINDFTSSHRYQFWKEKKVKAMT